MEKDYEIKEEEMFEQNEQEDGDTLAPNEVVEEQQEQPSEEQQEEVEAVEENIEEPQVQPQMFTQEQLNEIVGRTRMETREKTLRSFLEKYGVDTEDELNNLFGMGQSYNILNDDFNNLNTEMGLVKAENALLKSGISRERWEDAKLILNGKGLEVSEENILSELATHPEWNNASAAMANQEPQGLRPLSMDMAETFVNAPKKEVEPKTPSTIRKFGSGVPTTDNSNEDSVISKLFGLI